MRLGIKENLMSRQSPPMQAAESDALSRLIYAQVDERTLSELDRSCDEQTIPRSWLIAQILHEWAEHRSRQAETAVAA